MSQLWYETVSLESIANRASHVLLVGRAEPPRRAEELPIPEPTFDGLECPPFTLSWNRFDVIEVIRAPEGFADSFVEILPGDWDGRLDNHKSYYVDGVDESPIVMSYERSGDASGNTMIAFATQGERGLELVVSGALEGPEMLEQVRAIVAGATDPELEIHPADEDTDADDVRPVDD